MKPISISGWHRIVVDKMIDGKLVSVPEEVSVQVTIDERALIAFMAHRVIRSRVGKSVGLGGRVKARLVSRIPAKD